MKKRNLLFVLLLPVTIALVTGCGKSGGDVIARVGDDTIYADELNEMYNSYRFSFPTAQDEFNRRREMVDSMIVTRLLVQAAYDAGIDQSEDLSRVIMGNRDRFLLDALYQTHIAEKSEPTEAEIVDCYNKEEYELRASHIVLSDPDSAQAIFERVKAGEDFDQLAYDYSIDPQAKRNKGDLGYFIWGALVDGVQEAVFAMEPGEISPPVKSRFGYHIIKLVDKRPNEQRMTLEEDRDAVTQKVIGRKRIRLREAYFEGVKERYPITVDTTTFRYLINKREMMYPPQILAGLPKNDFDDAQLDRNEAELIAATWEGGQMTVKQYLTDVRNLTPNLRPNFEDFDSLATIIFELKKPEILALDALREGLDQDKGYLHKLKVFKELNMADIMKNDSISGGPPPDEGMIRQYYDEHPDEFTVPAKVHLFEILLGDELKARQLASDIKSLNQFKQKARELTERPGNRAKAGDLGYVERAWYPQIYDLAIKTPVGAIGGPVVTQGKYSIFYVVDKIEAQLKDFLGVKRSIVDILNRQNKANAIQAWVDERLKETNVEVMDDAIWATIDMTKYPDASTTNP